MRIWHPGQVAALCPLQPPLRVTAQGQLEWAAVGASQSAKYFALHGGGPCEPGPVGRAAAHVELRAGSSLFLPAGWWHQVVSEATGAAGHAAVNFWFS